MLNEPDPPYKRRRTEVFRRWLSCWSTVTACTTRKKRAAGQPGIMEFYHVCEFQTFLRLWGFAMFVSSTCNRRDTGISSSRRCRPRCKSREMKSIDKTVEPAPKPDYPELISFLKVGYFLLIILWSPGTNRSTGQGSLQGSSQRPLLSR